MPTSWSCICGMTFSTGPDDAGKEIPCPRCGHVNQAPEDVPEVVPIDDEDIPDVEPLDDEEEIPEMDVEEEVAAWDVKKNVEKKPQKKPKKNEDLTPFDVQESKPKTDVAEEEAEYTKKAAAAVHQAWAPLGAISLAEPAACIALGPGGAWGLAGQDDEVLVLNLLKGKKLHLFTGHNAVVTSIAMGLSADGAVSGDADGDLLSWEVSTGKRHRRLREHEEAISATALTSNGALAASGDHGGAVRLWNLHVGKPLSLDDADWTEKISAVAFSRDHTMMAAGGSKGRVIVWSIKTGKCVQRVRLPHQAVASLQFSPKADAIIAAAKPGKATVASHPKVWRLDIRTGRGKECFQPADQPATIPYGVQLDHGGKRLFSVGHAAGAVGFIKGMSSLEVWSLTTSKRLHTFSDLKADVVCLGITPDNMRCIASLTRPRFQVFAIPESEFVAITPPPRPDDRQSRRHG